MITVSNLAKTYGTQVLFEDVSLQLNAGERYGVVGANGSGKSTFLRILAGQETPSEGEVGMPKRARVGFLRQDHFLSDAQPIVDVVVMGDHEVHEAMRAKEEMLARPESEFDADAYAEVEDVILRNDGYALEARAGEILEGLGIPTEIHHQPLGTLSGGFKLRVLLAQVLAGQPDLLLLDEPNNHLDIVSVRWLEKFLVTFAGCVVVVSHDHRFLDNVCTKVLDVDYETMTQYTGNYSDFVAAKAEHRARMEAEISKREAEIAHQQAFIERFKAKATKARQAQSKKKLVERMSVERLPQSSRRYPVFRFKQRRPSGRQPLEAEGLRKAFGDNVVLDGVDLNVQRGDRLAIIGPNGIGKSTLLKIFVGRLEPDAGTYEWKYEAHPGYFAQDHRTVLDDPKHTVLTWLWDACPGETLGRVRGLLGQVLFSNDEVEKSVGNLSGGEAARLVLARLMVEEPNVLVLDEPTNHLDLEAIEALVAGLSKYEGTIIFVSHDRWFVSKLATRILEISHEGRTDFPGTYEEYLERCGDDHLDAEIALKQARRRQREAKSGGRRDGDDTGEQGAGKGSGRGGRGASGKGGAAGGARKKGGRRRDLERRHGSVTEELDKAERRIKEIEAVFCRPGFYEKTDHGEVVELQAEQQRLQERVQELMSEWEQLEEALS